MIDFHRDEHDDWVAVLGCLHRQHVRHNPPWQNRPWVATEAGRNDSLGRMLYCVKCRDNAPVDDTARAACTLSRMPAGFGALDATPLYDQNTVPQQWRQAQTMRSGVWALLQVISGSLTFCFTHQGDEVLCKVTPDSPRVIVAEQSFHIAIDGAVSCRLTCYAGCEVST
jgi:tellurite resistance-related uncharacterized protein